MSDVEEIQAAIDKLTGLKTDSTPGVWGGRVTILGITRVETDDHYIVAEVYGDEDEAYCNIALIAVLHRTIDAQLAILTNSRDWWNAWPKGDIDADVVALARAINLEVQR
jgi:hypothetical protein